VSDGVVCRSCGTQNDPGRDFCEQCGEYLAWAPTSMIPAVPDDASAGDTTSSEGDAGQDAPRSATSGARPGEPPGDEPEPRAGGGAPGAAEARDAGDEGDGSDGREAAAAGVAAGTAGSAGVARDAAGAPSAQAVEAGPAPERGRPPGGQDVGVPSQTRSAGASFPDQLVGIPESPPPTGEASLVLAPVNPVIGAAGVPAVDAGSALTFTATVRNESQIVDNYDLAVLGLPENWAVVTPSAAFLVPLGSGRGDSELELRIDIAPPRDYRSTAGIWTFELVALSRTAGTLAARAIAHFEVLPFQAWSIEVVPPVKSGRFKARYRTAVRNDGNAEQMLWPAAMDDTGKLRRRFAVGKLTIEAGEVGADTLTVRPRFPKLVGRVTEHRIGVDVVATEPVVAERELSAKEKLAAKAKEQAEKAKQQGKQAAAPLKTGKPPRPPVFNPVQMLRKKLRPDPALLSKLRPGGAERTQVTGTQVVYRQKPVVPLWLIALILLLALIAILVYLLWPQKTSVPSLVGQPDSFAAEKSLRQKGLVLNQPVDRRADLDADAGSVLEQTPAAGAKVDKGSSVSIVVADGATKVDVPRLKGLTRVDADKRLRRAGLELGETQPADAADNYVVRSQIPDAGLQVERGTNVRVFLRKPPPSPKQRAKDKKKAAAAAAAAAADKKEKADDVKVPDFKDKPLDEYEAGLEKLKLKPDIQLRISTTKSGTVLHVNPKVGKTVNEGDVVTVQASGGPAPVAVEQGPVVHVVNPVGGKELYRLPQPRGSAAEPSYLPGGRQVLYRSGTRFILADDGKDADFRTVYGGGDTLVRPTVASDGTTVAMIRREEGDGDLCLGRLDLPDLGRLCLPDDDWDLNGRISWRPDGKAILVSARRRGNPSVFAVRQYRTKTAFTIDPLKWTGRTPTPIGTPGKGVRVAVYSPRGTRIAAITNVETDRFELVFARAADLRLVQPIATDTQACDVAWRPDSIEVTVVQSDDACAEPLGKLVRFSRATPKAKSTVADKGKNPAYRDDRYR
jgi:beta-lactam-binding protein with PASTA domain